MSVKENEKNVTSINMLKPIFLLLLSFCKVMTFMGQIFIHNSLYCYKEFETNSFNENHPDPTFSPFKSE